MNKVARLQLFLCLCGIKTTWSFVSPVAFFTSKHDSNSALRTGSSGDENNEVDGMKQMLEASWNAQTMGVVPKDPNAAAEAAGEWLNLHKMIRLHSLVVC